MTLSWFQELLNRAHTALENPESADARAYLLSRGVTPALSEKYLIGYSYPPAAAVTHCSKEFMDWYGKYWYQRLVFPLTSLFGRSVGLVTRPLPRGDEKRNYQQFYHESAEVYPMVFGLHQAAEEIWRTEQVVIVEGVFDCLALAPYVPNTIAILTAHVPATVKKFFTRYVKRVWAALDMDAAGRMGAYRLAGLQPPREYWPQGWTPGPVQAPDGYQVRIVNYEGGKDPGDVAANGGLSSLVSRVAGATVEFTP